MVLYWREVADDRGQSGRGGGLEVVLLKWSGGIVVVIVVVVAVVEVVAVSSASESNETEIVDISALIAMGNLDHGKKVFKKCAACHSINKGGNNKLGQKLRNVMFRPVDAI